MYDDDMRYDGSNGSFDQKLTVFEATCRRVKLPKDLFMDAFPDMLKGLAKAHFYNNHLNERTYEDVCTHLRGYYEGPGYHDHNLEVWNNTTLSSIMIENPDKSTTEGVRLLIEKLRQLQFCLAPALRFDEFFHQKLVNACRGSPACRYAVADPPSNTSLLINKLRTSIITYEKEQGTINNTFYTDRRFHTKERFNDRNRQYGRKYDRQTDR